VPKRFKITKEQFKSVRDTAHWERFIREFEIDLILGDFREGHFDNALELGCGSGRTSKHLALYCKKLTAMEYNENLPAEQSDDKVTFITGDAQDLSRFGDGEMNLIFSSSLIEHLPEPDKCLAECGRVIDRDGLIVHTVPNRTWKIFNLLLYYPFGIKTVFGRIFLKNKSQWTGGPRAAESGLDSNLRPVCKKFSMKNLFPKTHGISRSHLGEFIRWGQKQWMGIFERNNLEVVEIIRLPFYFGWGYNFRLLIRFGNFLGLSSCTAYVLKKAAK
jgi:ubiquinone/menaquinone biosynthesis C-methylase UbiE